jgi:hypothetical protein
MPGKQIGTGLCEVAAPANVPLRWTDLSSWHPLLTSILGDLLEPGAIRRLGRVESSELYDDDPEWLDLVVAEFGGDEEKLVDLVSERLQWRTVRVFHGTRTADAGSFTEHGIRLHDRQQLESNIRALVGQRDELSWMAPTLDEKFEATSHLIDEGRCYLVVDERVLIEECGHYLLGGSEFVQGIIGPDRAQTVLGECAPTVIEVDLPLGRVTPSFLTEFSRKLIGEWAKVLRRERTEAGRMDFTFTLQEPVPAAWVVGHFHPEVVNDPHQLRRAVKVKRTYCLACEG